MQKLKDFRSLGFMAETVIKCAVVPIVVDKPKKVHYDVQRVEIKKRINILVRKEFDLLKIVGSLKEEYPQVCKIEPSYVRMQIATIGMGTNSGDWTKFYISPEIFTKS